MAAIAAIVFIALYFVEAGYGMLFDKKWGLPIPNKIAWICMEAPVFIVMFLLWNGSERQFETVPFLIFLFFELHYFQRSFIFPLLIKGKSKMPAGIMLMGITFNLLNGYMQGEWIFYLAPQDMYTKSWLHSPQFIVGTILFFTGMAINIQSDHIVRHLRKPGDTNHYLPKKAEDEVDEEQLSPKLDHSFVHFIARADVERLHDGEKNHESEGQRDKDEVEKDGHGKLQP